MRAASKALWTSGRDSVTRATTSPGPDRITRSEALVGPVTRAPRECLATSCKSAALRETRSPTGCMPARARLREECAEASAQAAMTVQPAAAATRARAAIIARWIPSPRAAGSTVAQLSQPRSPLMKIELAATSRPSRTPSSRHWPSPVVRSAIARQIAATSGAGA